MLVECNGKHGGYVRSAPRSNPIMRHEYPSTWALLFRFFPLLV